MPQVTSAQKKNGNAQQKRQNNRFFVHGLGLTLAFQIALCLNSLGEVPHAANQDVQITRRGEVKIAKKRSHQCSFRLRLVNNLQQKGRVKHGFFIPFFSICLLTFQNLCTKI